MKNRKKGFLLIECCVYIAICAILMATLMRWISQTILESGQHTIMVQKGLANALVHDVLMRDVQCAPCDLAVWRLEPTYILWKVDDATTIGWYKDQTHLVRKEGLYDSTRQKWSKHHASTVAYNVNIFQCIAHKKENTLQGVEIKLGMDGNEPSGRHIRLRNGRSYETRP